MTRAPPARWASLTEVRAGVRSVYFICVVTTIGLATLEVGARAVRVWPLIGMILVAIAAWTITEWLLGQWFARLQWLSAAHNAGLERADAQRAPQEVRSVVIALNAMAQRIREQDLALQEAATAKDTLIKEIHHRVRNNLQVLASLVNMQRRAQADSSADAALADMCDRIAALALIHRTLYQGPDLRRIDVGHFLDELIKDQIVDRLGPELRMRTRLEAEILMIESDRLAALALFAVEAITNARRRAVGSGEGSFLVRLSVKGAAAELLLADEGATLAPDLSCEGRGRTLMAGFARQLHGGVETCANGAGGVTVRLTFPIEAPSPASKVEAIAEHA